MQWQILRVLNICIHIQVHFNFILMNKKTLTQKQNHFYSGVLYITSGVWFFHRGPHLLHRGPIFNIVPIIKNVSNRQETNIYYKKIVCWKTFWKSWTCFVNSMPKQLFFKTCADIFNYVNDIKNLQHLNFLFRKR